MFNSATDIEDGSIARRLMNAWHNVMATEPPSERVFPLDDVRALKIAMCGAGLVGPDRVVGYKIGLTAASAQAAMGYGQPVFGRVYGDHVFPSGATVSRMAFLDPKVEPECAFIMGTDLVGTDVTAEQARAAVMGVVPAFEIADSRYGVSAPSVEDLIVDNGGGAGAVLSLSDAIPIAAFDLGAVRLTVDVDGEPICTDTSMPGASNDDRPYELLAWLVRQLAEQQVTLRSGQFVLTGSWVTPIGVAGVTTVNAMFSGFGTVTVQLT